MDEDEAKAAAAKAAEEAKKAAAQSEKAKVDAAERQAREKREENVRLRDAQAAFVNLLEQQLAAAKAELAERQKTVDADNEALQ